MRCKAVSNGCGGAAAHVMFSKSTDGGVTWSKAKSISKMTLAPAPCGASYGCLPNTNERVSDIPVIAVDASGGAHNGKLYVVDYTWTGSYMKVQVISSTDGGTIWSAPVEVAPASDTHDQFFPWINVDQSNGWVGVSSARSAGRSGELQLRRLRRGVEGFRRYVSEREDLGGVVEP